MSTEAHRLPPGQALTGKFPLVGERDTSAVPPLEDWRLIVDGLVEPPLELSWDEVLALPQRELEADIHCVTGWTHLGMRFTGLPLADLLATRGVRVLPEARFVRFVAYSPRAHDTSLPVERALAETWLAHSWGGAPLTPEHGGPLRTVTPSRYFYKSLKWVHRIEFLAADRPGFWERTSSYHNNADPWPGDERYTTGSHDPEEIERFRNAASYVPWRGPKKILLGVDLYGWSPATRDLGDLYLKACDLRGARLDGADLRGANLTRSDLAGATLRGADLRGADLEGVSFLGADLTGADLRGAFLSATRFVGEDRTDGAKIDGLRWSEDAELLEDQEIYLRDSASCK
jgi:DMSO/TMAO reductase YedYZ molybdopterin-dependent catalytic subunit